jgi:hypothetical protein
VSESLHYDHLGNSPHQSDPRALADNIVMLKKDTFDIEDTIY